MMRSRYSSQLRKPSAWRRSSSMTRWFGLRPAKARCSVAAETPPRRASARTPSRKASKPPWAWAWGMRAEAAARAATPPRMMRRASIGRSSDMRAAPPQREWRKAPPGLSHLDFAELGEEAGQEGVVPCGAHALCLHGPLGAFELGKVESEAPQQGDVLRSVILTGSGLVFIHGHVENPVQAVLHSPMGAGHLAEVLGAERSAEQVVGGFRTDLGADLAGADHPANGRQPRPGMSLLQPGDVGRDQA